MKYIHIQLVLCHIKGYSQLQYQQKKNSPNLIQPVERAAIGVLGEGEATGFLPVQTYAQARDPQADQDPNPEWGG